MHIRLATAFVIGFALMMMLWPLIGKGQEHSHPPQDSGIHEQFYATWYMPDNPARSCCDKKDCYPTEARFKDGHWFALRREDGEWLRVPPEKIEQVRDNPDGRNHLCAPPPGSYYPPGTVFCFIAGAGT